jgi:hypothetical protein
MRDHNDPNFNGRSFKRTFVNNAFGKRAVAKAVRRAAKIRINKGEEK